MADHPLKGYVQQRNPARHRELGAKNILANLERYSKAAPGTKNSQHEECLHRMLAIYLEGSW